jgi:hypothetical protein
MLRSLPLLFACAGLMLPVSGAERGPNLIDPAMFGLGTPGFGTQVTASGEQEFEDGDGGLDLVTGRVRVPLWAYDFGGGTLLGASCTYNWAALGLGDTLGISNLALHDVSLQLGLAHFPKADAGWMGLAIASPGWASDFSAGSSEAFNFTGVLVAGYQFSPQLTAAVAGVYMHAIGESVALPGVGVIWRPSQEWLVQATAPVFAVGYQASDSIRYSFSAYPAGGAWAVDRVGSGGEVEAVKLQGWRAGLGVEYRLDKHWRITAQAGMNFGGQLELRDSSERVLFGRDLEPSPFALLGVTWAF